MENFKPNLKRGWREVTRRYSHFHIIFWDSYSLYFHGKIRLGKGLGIDISFWGSVQYHLHSAGVDHHNVLADMRGKPWETLKTFLYLPCNLLSALFNTWNKKRRQSHVICQISSISGKHRQAPLAWLIVGGLFAGKSVMGFGEQVEGLEAFHCFPLCLFTLQEKFH